MILKSSRLLAIVLLAALAITPVTASATLISNLISLNQSITFGTLQFSNFSYLASGDMPPGTAVNVLTATDGTGDLGLIFQGAFLDFAPGSGFDALIGFTVTELDPLKQLIGATLAGNPAVLGGSGFASVTETFLPTDTSLILTIFNSSPGSAKLIDSGTFALPKTTVMVQKDLLAFSSAIGGGIATMSFVTQIFHETAIPIPEPGSLMLLVLGFFGFTLLVRRPRLI